MPSTHGYGTEKPSHRNKQCPSSRCRIREFWEEVDSGSQKPDAKKQELNSKISKIDAGSEEMRYLYKASISGQSHSEQGF